MHFLECIRVIKWHMTVIMQTNARIHPHIQPIAGWFRSLSSMRNYIDYITGKMINIKLWFGRQQNQVHLVRSCSLGK